MARTRPLANLNGQVTEILALKIVHGEYAAEQSLPPEKELHESLGVSRTTLREAVKNLSAKGLVTVGPSRGTRVRPRAEWNLLDPEVLRWRLERGVSVKLIRDMYELRECFEPAASQFAAERASDEDRAAIWKSYERLAASKETGGDQSVAADVDFHVAILRSANNDLFASFANVIEGTLEASFVVARIRRNLSEDDVALHAAVAKAIIKRNGPAAKRATERLLEKSKAAQMEAAASSQEDEEARRARFGAAIPKRNNPAAKRVAKRRKEEP
jgi:DNA-binding FadR family transcriptional regulator